MGVGGRRAGYGELRKKWKHAMANIDAIRNYSSSVLSKPDMKNIVRLAQYNISSPGNIMYIYNSIVLL